MNGNFPNKLTRKTHTEQCLALYSRWQTQQTHACFHVQFQYHVCYRNKPFHSNTLLVLLCNISYHIVTTVSRYVSYCEKMYRCRPKCECFYWPEECETVCCSSFANENIVFLICLMFIFECPIQISLFRIHLVSVIKCYLPSPITDAHEWINSDNRCCDIYLILPSSISVTYNAVCCIC